MNPCKPSLPKKIPLPYNEGEDPQETHLTLDGSEDRETPSTSQMEVVEGVVEAVEVEAVEVEAVEVEEVTKEETTMTEDLGPS